MKKGKDLKIILLLITGLLITGCYNYDVEMTVNEDRSVDFDLKFVIQINQEQMIEQTCKTYGDAFTVLEFENEKYCCPSENASKEECIGMEEDTNEDTSNQDIVADNNELNYDMYDDEEQNNLKNKGYKINEINENNQTGMSITKTFKNIDDISKENEEVKFNIEDLGKEDFKEYFFSVKKGLLENIYKAHIIFDLTSDDSMMDVSMYENLIKFKYIINLPVEANSHNNAMLTNNNKTLTWKLEFGKINEIKYEFTLESETSKYIKIGISALSSIVILISLIIIIKKIIKK